MCRMAFTRLFLRRTFRHTNTSWPFCSKTNKIPTRSSSTGATVSSVDPLKQKIFNIFRFYEDVVGLTEVKAAQNRVIQAEQKFMLTQEERRKRQQKLLELQARLKEIHAQLDKTHRGEDRYLTLITQEHAIIREERTVLQEFHNLEKDERDYFSALSRALRESHEKERAQGERTKYWSIIGSICGAAIGIIGATINNRIRFNQLRDLVERSSSQSEVQLLVANLSDEFKKHCVQVGEFLEGVRRSFGLAAEQVRDRIERGSEELGSSAASKEVEGEVDLKLREVLELVKGQRDFFAKETKEIKALLAAQRALEEGEDAPKVAAVYIGEDVREIVSDSQRQIEWRIKINSLATVALIYGALALAVPLIAAFFKGS
ncbi:mitochondrial potassium channel-like [Ornithodoros turicata]|uniref:mitochondrial potassium channel-like n=1 Tax=Ornithodoros turicata TaxID=34597 RepID=UPI003139F6BB